MHEGKAADPPPKSCIPDSEPVGYQETISVEKQETPKPLPSEWDDLRRMNQPARNSEDESYQTGVPMIGTTGLPSGLSMRWHSSPCWYSSAGRFISPDSPACLPTSPQ